MANYSLSINSTFQPFTYQELVAPILHQQQVFDNLAEQYEKLSSQADVLEAMGSNDRDVKSGAYSKYKSYSDSLRDEVDYFYKYGLNTESRQRLTDMRRRYNTDIVPIQNAWTKREKEADDQMKALLSNPHLMFTRDARNTSLDEYLANPTGGYGVINGTAITAQMSNMAKNLAKQIQSGKYGHLESIDPYTYNYIMRYGLDANVIKDWQNSPILSQMYKQVMESNGVTPEVLKGSMNADTIMKRAAGYAEMGMWDAMGEDKSQVMDNFKTRLDAQAEKELDVYANKKVIDASFSNNNINGDVIPSVAVGLTPTKEYQAKHLEALNTLKAKGSYDGLDAKYFGKTIGKVNPIAIYDEFIALQKKLGGGDTSANYSSTGNSKMLATSMKDYDLKMDAHNKNSLPSMSARDTILEKYKQFGVTKILSKEQYEALKAAGYTSETKFSSNRHSSILNGFNNSVIQDSSYSVHLTNYDSVNKELLPKLRGGKFTIWEENSQTGHLGSTVKVSKMNITGKKGDNTIKDVQYDPECKGKLKLLMDDGKYYYVNAFSYDSDLANIIEEAENNKVDPRIITKAIKDHLNSNNPVQSNTDSDARTY